MGVGAPDADLDGRPFRAIHTGLMAKRHQRRYRIFGAAGSMAASAESL